MSLFGKKVEPPPMQPPVMPPPLPPVHAPGVEGAQPKRGYGVTDLILLMKTIPTDRHPELVVRVVKSTLESVGVHANDIIQDALNHEGAVRDRIAALEGEIDGLEQQIEHRRGLIAELHVNISDLVYARERWQGAESGRHPGDEEAPGVSKPHSLPPPLPPPFPKSSPAKSSDTVG
jgi:hypothetical protein